MYSVCYILSIAKSSQRIANRNTLSLKVLMDNTHFLQHSSETSAKRNPYWKYVMHDVHHKGSPHIWEYLIIMIIYIMDEIQWTSTM